MKNFKKGFMIFLLLFIFLIITATSYPKSVSEDLSHTFFRLHIIANSDTTEDQALKLKVRDAILDYMKTLSYENMSKEEAMQISSEHLEDFKAIAKQVIHDNGYSYDVSLHIQNDYFPTKVYGNISLPAGYYDALKIEIGDAIGQNWWCSLFPPLCFVDVSSGVIKEDDENYLKENLNNEEFTIISGDSENVKLKFKIIEFLNEKNML